jgi:eukaryotic-like serine/threonine-protein kinase
MAEETPPMQPSPKPADPTAVTPPGGAPDETTPTPVDSGEGSFESLGSTRVTEYSPPPRSPRPDWIASDSIDPEPTVTTPTGNEPTSLGDFRLVGKIGEGAMGAVYRARQISFDRDVALKVLFPHIASNPKLVDRLNREGQVMGALDHPNIVQAYGVYEDQGWHFIALEYLECQSMQKWLNQLGRISLGDAVHILLHCARALDYAHMQGVVHRDIKPDNILITKEGQVKVADLGMVKIDDEDMALTQTGHAVGTPWYMPLEQAKNAKATDGRSDIYAMGCMLYCFVTGSPPFAGKTLLDKLPKYRYQTCAELIQDLESLHLAHPRLEFLSPAKPAPTAAPPAVPSRRDTAAPAVADPNIWYVRFKDAGGQKAVHKLTTSEVQKMLVDNTLAPNNKASRDEKQGYRALATYKEFQNIALVKASKQSADDRAVRYRTLYKKIEEQANQREKDAQNQRPDTPPWQPLAIKIGFGVAGVTLVALFFAWISGLMR